MTPGLPHRASFVLRIWREEAGAAGGQPRWRAWVQHVRSRETVYVQDVASLLEFIEHWAGELSGEERPVRRLK